jgi:uncharacterized protein (TIGR02453 family)
MAAKFDGFSPAALKFLKGLKKNNNREWFQARKEIYDLELKAPLEQLVNAINERLLAFAPDYLTEPKQAIFRIYRDTRFSNDKTPYKTHIAAWFKRRGMVATSGGGFYFHISAEEVVVAGGLYMPPKEQLAAVRHHLLEHHEQFRALAASKKLKKLAEFEGASLLRDPKGFPKDHPASDLIRKKQWGWHSTLPAEVALQPTLLGEITSRMEVLTPVVEFLNEPLLVAAKPRREIFFD